MRVTRFLARTCALALGTMWPGMAGASEQTVYTNAAMPVALFLALIIAATGCILLRRRALAAEKVVKQLEAEKSFDNAVSALREEQAIIWPFSDGKETVSAGLANLLGVPAESPDWLNTLKSVLTETDATALDQAVDALRLQRQEFDLTVRTKNGERVFLLRGDCVVSGAIGAAVLLIGERTSDITQINRLEAESQALHRVLDALPVPVWIRDNALELKYANQAYREAVEADREVSHENLP